MFITFLYEIVRKAKEKQMVGWRFLYKINKLLANIICRFSLCTKSGLDKESKIIVSLTTFPARINSVNLTIKSILKQKRKPCKVILWLANEQFNNVEKDIPQKLKKLEKYGLEIRFCDDLKPHKKYYYTMKEYKDYSIVTIDDDIIYPTNFIDLLYRTHLKYPETICCTWATVISFDSNKELLPYKEWYYGNEQGYTEPTYSLMPVGCGGVLYPPNSVNEEVFNKEKIKKLCLLTDDLWLKCMSLKNNTKAVKCRNVGLIYFGILNRKNTGLYKYNVNENNNDKALKNILSEYSYIFDNIKNEINNKI